MPLQAETTQRLRQSGVPSDRESHPMACCIIRLPAARPEPRGSAQEPSAGRPWHNAARDVSQQQSLQQQLQQHRLETEAHQAVSA